MVRVEVNRQALRALLRSREVQADLDRRARAIASAAGEGMVAVSSPGRNRARSVVVTSTIEAMRAEAVERRLTRAIDAGR